MTIRAHAVKLYRDSKESKARSSVTVDWPVEHWLFAAVHEYSVTSNGWWWEIRDSKGRRIAVSDVKKESGARRAVMIRLEKLTEKIRNRPDVAELERAKVAPLIAAGYSRVAGENAEAA